MLTVRRIYLYLVAAISLVVVTWSIIGLLRLILDEGIGRGQITGLATWLAAIIVGLPIFLFHWLTAQKYAAADGEERASVVRRIFFYGLMGAGAAPIISNVYRLVDNVFLSLTGGTFETYYPYDLTTGQHLAAIVVWGVVWFYLWRQVRQDNQTVRLQDASLTVRRLYLVALAVAGLVMVSLGAVSLLQTLLEIPAGFFWRNPVAHGSAKLVVGGPVWVVHWLLLQRAFLSAEPAEERSVLRKAYLYLAVFVFSVMAVVSATGLLKRLIELALGDEPSPEPLLSQISLQLPLMVVGAVFWAYHWQVLRQDAGQAPEAPRQASVRRIYAYLVAAIGLATLVTGLVGLLTILIDMLTSPAVIGLAYYREQVALFAAMVIVGVPVWLIPWRAMQNLALQEGAGSADERRSTVRKIYLYFYVFVAALAVFGSIGWFVYHILVALLGADLPEDFLTLVLDALAIGLLAGAVWSYHWWAIRQDGRLELQDQARRLADIAVVVLDGQEGRLGQAIIQHLQHDLPGIQIRPIGLTPEAMATMSAPPLTNGRADLETARYIIGSWETLTATEVETAVAASPALKLAVPTAAQHWVWAGIRQRSTDYYARQAARGVKQSLEGEEISPGREIDLSTVVAVVIGLILFLALAGSIIGVVSSAL